MRSAPTEYDVRLGAKVAARRMALGLTQSDLGKSLGVSFQQVQKYEKGVNRVPASRYSVLCRFLEMPLSALLDMDVEGAAPVEDRLGAVRGGAELAGLFLALGAEQRRLLLEVARAFQGAAARRASIGEREGPEPD